MMKWRIRESSHGGFFAEYGAEHAGGIEVGFKPGCTLPCFIVYHAERFDTKRQAEAYIKKTPNPMK